MFKYKKTDHIPFGLKFEESPPKPKDIVKPESYFIAPRKIDHRDLCIPTDNQLNMPYCTGYATAGYIEIKHWQKKHIPIQYNAPHIYFAAKDLDGFEGDGSWIKFAVEGAKTLNMIDGKVKHIERRTSSVKFAVLEYGACIAAFRITNEWNQVNKKTGDIRNLGNKANILGGHAVLCFSGDTKVPLLDGRSLTFYELESEFKNKSFWVYSCNNGKIVPGLAHSVRKTGTNRQLLRITLDNGKIIKCTGNHLFLMRDGSYKKASKLNKDDSIMPLYRHYHKYGYESIYQPFSNEWELTHRSFCDSKYILDKGKIVRHHIDFNKKNNAPDNLRLMTWDEHTLLHSENTELLSKYAKSRKGRRKSRALMLKNWQNKNFRTKMASIQKSNGIKVAKMLKQDSRCGFQAIDKEVLKERGRNIKNRIFSHTQETKEKISKVKIEKYKKDKNFKIKMAAVTSKNIKQYNEDLKNGKKKITEKQKAARSANAKRLNELRWGKKTLNHKVVLVEKYTKEDVYDLTVEEYHNFAIDAGVFVHNCCGYDEYGVYIQNSWGKDWGIWGFARLSWEQVKRQFVDGVVIEDLKIL